MSVFFLVSSGAWSGPPNWAQATNALIHLSLGSVALLSAIAVIVGLIFHPLQFVFIQFYEGYWGRSDLARRVAVARAMTYWRTIRDLRNRQNELLDRSLSTDLAKNWRQITAVELERIQRSFPDLAEEFLPTRLGNVLRRYEQMAGAPFALNVLDALPHVALAAPARDVAYLNDQRSTLDLAVRFSATSLLATVLTVIFLWNDGFWLLIALVPYGFSYLSYRGAVVSAREYGIAIAALIALNRHTLYERLGLPKPTDLEEEQERNKGTGLKSMFDLSPNTKLSYVAPVIPWWRRALQATFPADRPRRSAPASADNARPRPDADGGT